MSGNAYGSLGGIGTFDGRGVVQPDNPDDYIREIRDGIVALRNEYVTPKLFKRQKGRALAIGSKAEPLLCDGVPVNRIYIQAFTTNAVLSVFFSNAVGAGDIPDLQVQGNPFPTVIPIPGIPIDITVVNAGAVAVDYTVILSSAAG